MTQEGGTPPDFWARVQQVAERAVDNYARSGAARNSSLSGGRFTIKGGALVVESASGVSTAYFGAVTPALPDGTYQAGLILRREDNTIAMAMYDANPAGGLKQFLAIYDRAGNIIFSDDTESGQGISRPWIGTPFYRQRFVDWTVSTTSDTWEGLWKAELVKQHPRLSVATQASMDTTGTTGEVRVVVSGTQLGDVQSIGFGPTVDLFGPAPVDGTFGKLVTVEIQGRRSSASGALRVEPLHMLGRQT